RPPMQANLFNAPENRLGGSVVNNLPVPLQDVVLIHKGNIYSLGTLLTGDTNRKQITTADPNGLQTWLPRSGGYVPTYNYGSGRYNTRPASPEPASQFMRDLMFHERSERTQNVANKGLRNASLRELDQSWRVDENDPGDFAILVGRLPVEKDSAE